MVIIDSVPIKELVFLFGLSRELKEIDETAEKGLLSV